MSSGGDALWGPPSTYAAWRTKLSTFVDDCPNLVDKRVDALVVRAYCPTSALLLRPQHGRRG